MAEPEDSRTVTGASSKWESGPAIAPGDCIGRYTIRARIGAGGMGEVYAAEDSELGRAVALKLIRPDRLARSPTARLRLVREAQALARLHHPNVVCVHDVGTEGDQLFVAMELVEGPTLHDWLHAAERGWREVLEVFLAAGRGLAVAHQAGIVHRDFKPSNVIVGKDRVVVVDFGLARAGDEDPAEAHPRAQSPADVLTASLTMTGEYLGTPQYMAPEQKGGGEVSAQADQYSFCVALREALQAGYAHGDGPAPLRADVPGWVGEALERGLLADPAARWPSMQALLAELGRDRQRGPRRALLAAGAVALAGLAGWGLLRPSAADPCGGGPARLAGVWDPSTRKALEAAFLATGHPFARPTWEGVRARLEGYAGRWTAMYQEACRATRVEGRQSDSLLDLRMGCLERRRAVLASLTGLWARGVDGPALDHADESVSGLEGLAECADARALAGRDSPPADPALAQAVADARRRLDGARALLLAFRLQEARKEAAGVREQAEGTGWPLVKAEAAQVEGTALTLLADPSAEATLLEAARLASQAGDDRLAARALTMLVRAVDHQAPGRAVLAAGIAEVVVLRTGDEALRAALLRNRGRALSSEGRHDDARLALLAARGLLEKAVGAGDAQTLEVTALLVDEERLLGHYAEAQRLGEQNLAATIALLGPEHPQVVTVLDNLAAAAGDGSDQESAARFLRMALAVDEKVTGPDSAQTSRTLSMLGAVERVRGNLGEAQALLERALAIAERVHGPEHGYVAATLTNLGDLRRKQGRFADAEVLLQRARAIVAKVYGPEHEKVALVLQKLGHVRLAAGDWAGAAGWYRQAYELRRKVQGPQHSMTLYNQSLLGTALAELHRCAEARPLLEAASAGLEKAVGERHTDFIGTLRPLAECDLSEGRPAQALPRLERSLALEAQTRSEPWELGETRLSLGRALWALGRATAAVASVRAAEAELETSPAGALKLAQARRWLQEHGATSSR